MEAEGVASSLLILYYSLLPTSYVLVPTREDLSVDTEGASTSFLILHCSRPTAYYMLPTTRDARLTTCAGLPRGHGGGLKLPPHTLLLTTSNFLRATSYSCGPAPWTQRGF